MHYRNARALLFVACAVLYPLSASAIDFYPGRITDLWASSTAVNGGLYLQ